MVVPASLKGGLQIKIRFEDRPACTYYLSVEGSRSFVASGPALATLRLKESDIEAMLKNEAGRPDLMGDAAFAPQVFRALVAPSQTRSVIGIRCS